MIRLLTIASFFVASIRLINSNEYDASRALTPSNRENIDSLSAEALSISQLPLHVVNFAEEKKENDKNNYVITEMPENTKLDALKVITECDYKRTLKNCADDVEKKSVGEHQRKKGDDGPLSIKSGDNLVDSQVTEKTTNKTNTELKPNVYKRGPSLPSYLTSSIPLTDNKTTTTDKESATQVPQSWQVKSTELVHEASLVSDNLYEEFSTFNPDDDQRNYDPTEIDQPTFKTPNKFKSKVTKSDKVLHTTLGHIWDSLPITPRGPDIFVKIRNYTDDQHLKRRPRIQDILKITNNSPVNISRLITPKQTTFGKVRYIKPLEVSPNTTIPPSNNTEQITLSLPTSFVDTTEFDVTFPTVEAETTQVTYASHAFASAKLNNTRQTIYVNHSIEKLTQEIPWPVKKEAIVEGDIILGGLMMVHEREDSITCGPVMPQGGIQALEAMLFTLDRLNSSPEPLLPNITLGAHILDDCDKDTYGLEMAVDFIKGK